MRAGRLNRIITSGVARRPAVQSTHFIRDDNLRNPPVNGFAIQWASDQQTTFFTDNTKPSVTFVPTSVLDPTVQVQVQWAHFQDAFSWYDSHSDNAWTGTPDGRTMGSDYTLTDVPVDTATTTYSPVDLDFNYWLVRVRAGNGTSWGLWSAAVRVSVYATQLSNAFYIDQNVGMNFNTPRMYAAMYIDENVGLADLDVVGGGMFIDMNIGVNSPYPIQSSAFFIDENVTPDWTAPTAAAAYLDMNIDSTVHPTPHIWWIVPVQGREGWLFHLYGHGFGDTQSAFNGRVLINDIQTGVITWERVAASLQQNYLSLTLRPGSTVGSILKVLLNTPSGITVQTGDRIVWDEYWESPAGTNLGFGLSFVVGNTEYGSNSDGTRTDNAGMLLRPGTDRTPAYGTWLHREYTIQSGDNNDAIGSFYFYLIAQSTTQGLSTVRLRNVGVISGQSNVAKWWAVPPTIMSYTPPVPVTAQNGATVDSTSIYSPDVMIDPASGLVDQTILPEHGHIVVSVPEGAVSGPVKVRLTT